MKLKLIIIIDEYKLKRFITGFIIYDYFNDLEKISVFFLVDLLLNSISS